MDYILAKKEGPCVFCDVDRATDAELDERLILCRTAHAFVVLKLCGFADGDRRAPLDRWQAV